MKSSAKHIKLTSIDDLFSTEESRIDEQREKVQDVPLTELYPFKNHPFKVQNDERMQETVESIKEYGVLVPAIARPREEGGYELVAGHRRHFASQLAGMDTMPVIIRDLDDDAATIIMVDSNLQRESLLPSERAWAYKMKLEAIRRRAGRPSNNSRQVVGNLESADIVGQATGESGRQVQRFIRLTQLIPQIMDMVDDRKIAFNPAVELSYLSPDEQTNLLDAMESEQATPSLSQAQRLKRFSQEGNLTLDMMRVIMSEEKKPVEDKKLTFEESELNDMFPKSFPRDKRKTLIKKLVAKWVRSYMQEQSR
ncbi:MAG: ParB/RepB/Spo0J family partition protein [Clostridia bacterium]|nr:ParB/RepB/Spo0J family partition protein [Clostridia bacterium]